MSDTVGSDRHSVGTTGRATDRATGQVRQTVEEAYAFACLNCGHGWEQAYEIEHHVDAAGRPFVTYLADGAKVPSPLTRPSCVNCGGQHVRIMGSGQVSAVASRWARPRIEQAGTEQPGTEPPHAERPVDRGVHRAGHWSVLHFLHRRQRAEPHTGDDAA